MVDMRWDAAREEGVSGWGGGGGGLVKIDVEGYEAILVPAMASFFRRTGAAALVALHPSYLPEAEADRVVQALADVFPFVYSVRSEVNSELNFSPNFEGLVLGCIDADFCK